MCPQSIRGRVILGLVMLACNPSHWEGWGRRIVGSGQAWTIQWDSVLKQKVKGGLSGGLPSTERIQPKPKLRQNQTKEMYLLLFLLLWSLTRTAWHGRNYPGGQSEGSSSCKRRHGHRSMCWLMTSHPKSESRRRYRTVLSSFPPFHSTETPAQRGCYPLVDQTSVENIADTPRGGSSGWLWV